MNGEIGIPTWWIGAATVDRNTTQHPDDNCDFQVPNMSAMRARNPR